MVKVFDLDGTLLDSNGIWRWVDETFLQRHNCVLTDEYNDYVAHAIFPDAAHFTRTYYGLQISEDEIMDAWRSLARDAYANTLPLKPGAKEYLAQCYGRGEQLALYTSSEPSLCRAALKHHDLLPYFSHIFFAQDLKLEKKFPDSFLTLSQILGEAPNTCWLFDDSPIACQAAKTAGWYVVGIRDALFSHSKVEMQEICNQFIDNLTVLLK